jgi:polar amino acid transport system ATP-binding protein
VTDHGVDLLAVVGGPDKTADVVVQMEDVHKSFGTLAVLRGITLTVRRGECICVVGPSGSGKTTLIRCINALDSIASGQIIVNGHQLGMIERNGQLRPAGERDLARQRQEIGMVFQRFNLFPHLTALENVITGPVRVRSMPRSQAEPLGRALLSRVGLEDKMTAYPRQLSGGQQQRVAICRALAMRPALMLFDEPTSALDPEMIGEVLEVIAELQREGMTMLIVTHEMKFARHTAHRVVMMDDGLIVEDAPPERFFDSPTDERTRRFLSKVL